MYCKVIEAYISSKLSIEEFGSGNKWKSIGHFFRLALSCFLVVKYISGKSSLASHTRGRGKGLYGRQEEASNGGG
jgi:hypothetical protein